MKKIVITKKMIEEAMEIRKVAAKKWNCDVKEIFWPACVSMAMRGEKMSIDLEFVIEKIEIVKPIGKFIVEISPCAGMQGYKAMIDGKSCWLCEDCGKNTLMYDRPQVVAGKKFAGMSLDEENLVKVKAQIKRVRDFHVAQNDAKVITSYTVARHSTYGYSAYTEPASADRTDVTEFNNLLKGYGHDKDISLKITSMARSVSNDMGEYSITDYYEFSADGFRDMVAEIKKLVAEKEAEKTRAEQEKHEKRAAEIAAMSDKEIVEKFLSVEVKVNECGEFAQDEADACISFRCWKKDAPEDVRKASEALPVEGRNGKVYTYRKIDENSTKLMIEKHADLVRKARELAIK